MNNEFQTGNADNIGTAQITAIEVTKKEATKMTVKVKRSYNLKPVDDVLKTAKSQFMRQVIKNTDTKRKCIEVNISKRYEDALRFWADFNRKVGALLDSVRFNDYCKKKGHIAKQVAEHTTFEGIAFYNTVIQGDYSQLDEMAYMFNDYLFKDTENIYNRGTEANIS